MTTKVTVEIILEFATNDGYDAERASNDLDYGHLKEMILDGTILGYEVGHTYVETEEDIG